MFYYVALTCLKLAIYIDQAILKLKNLPASAPTPTPNAGKVCTTMPSIVAFLKTVFMFNYVYM